MKKTYVYLIILALVAIIVVLAFNFVNTPEYKFAEAQTKNREECADASYVFPPDAVAKVVINKDKHTTLIDVRSRHDFVNGHLPNAKHIDKSTVLNKKNYTYFSNLKNNNKQVIFYGNDVLEANVPFMILKQMGVENIGISCEGYNFFNENDLKHIAATKIVYPNDESAVVDFSKYIEVVKQKAIEKAKAEKEKVKKLASKPRRIVKKKVLSKAKQKPVIEEEEEEGC